MTRAPSPATTPLEFVPLPETPPGEPVYLYRGLCPHSGEELVLPRTRAVELLALELAQSLPWSEGKMLGVLLVRDGQGRLGYGKAYSGQLEGQVEIPGWVPPLHLPAPLPGEQATLSALAGWKEQLERWAAALAAHPFPQLEQVWRTRFDQLRERHRQARLERARARREGTRDRLELEAESRLEKRQKRELKAEQEQAISDCRADYEALVRALEGGRRTRRALSRALQAEMHQQLGQSVESLLGCPLERLYPNGVPTGSGDCCAPKLLAWATREGLRPLALAELWWGPDSVGDKRAGRFYPACQQRCQPLLGPLLSVATRPPHRILYQDASLLVLSKPGGLLTVPGRYRWNQDSLLSRLRQQWPEVLPVHRLDLETSGVVVFARSPGAQRALRGQFERRTVRKVYQALLSHAPARAQGRIEAALAPDPERKGRYRVDPLGRIAVTEYRTLCAGTARVELIPLTGRSHQLRAHAAQVLGCPIRGDRLYGTGGERLKLHAHALELAHPLSGEPLRFTCELPF